MKQKHNRDVLEEFVRVQLFVDRLPLSDESDLEATLLRQNRELQETWFGDISTPAFAIVTPDGKTILSKFVGTEQNEGDFAAFLEEGLASWKKVAAAETPTKVRVAGQ